MQRALVVAVAVVLVGTTTPAGAAPATFWRGVPTAPTSGDTESVYFEDVEVVSPTATFAIGWARHTLPGVTETRNLVERWDGTAWRIMVTPDNEHAPTTNFLYGVSASAATDVWAVGTDFGNDGPHTAYSLHFDGTRWSLGSLPSPLAGRSAHALDVATVGRNHTWAVGSAGSLPTVAALWHRAGATWVTSAIPRVPGCRADGVTEATQVTVTPTGAVYASGYCDTAHGSSAFVLRLAGATSWRVVAVLPYASAIEELDAAADGTVYAAGRAGPEWQATPMVLAISGSTVTSLPSPPRAGATPVLTAVAVTRDGVTVAGSGVRTANGVDPYVATWRDGAWTRQPVTGARGVAFTAVDGSPTGPTTWAMGRAGADPRGSAARPVR